MRWTVAPEGRDARATAGGGLPPPLEELQEAVEEEEHSDVGAGEGGSFLGEGVPFFTAGSLLSRLLLAVCLRAIVVVRRLLLSEGNEGNEFMALEQRVFVFISGKEGQRGRNKCEAKMQIQVISQRFLQR